MTTPERRPPSVDRLARSVSDLGLPHQLLVIAAREAIADGDPDGIRARAEALARQLMRPVVNATGVLLHTNLGRAPLAVETAAGASNLELSLDHGARSSRQAGVGMLAAAVCGAEAAMVVNNGAAAVMLATAALAQGRQVVASRGESVEIGGGFRIPDVVRSSGAVLVDVGTTNRTYVDDYQRAISAPDGDVACILRVHPSNFWVKGFTSRPTVGELTGSGVPVLVDLGSGLVDSRCPWLTGGPPPWLANEPAVRQTLANGAALVTFSGDKLLGGPQAGVIVGDARLVEQCERHPLARAVRPGGLVISAMQRVLWAYLNDEAAQLPFWRQAITPVESLRRRAQEILTGIPPGADAEILESEATIGAGAAPGTSIPSVALVFRGDQRLDLRRQTVPVIARVAEKRTWCDLRSVVPEQDQAVMVAAQAIAKRPPPHSRLKREGG